MLGVPASRLRRQHGLLLALAAIIVLAAGCGGDSGSDRLLSKKQAADLRGTLDEVEQDVQNQNCTGAAQQAVALRGQIDSIRRIDSDLRRALRSSARHLETVVTEKCSASEPTTTAPETTTTTPAPDEGATGATGTEGDQGKQKKPKKEKPPKGEKPPKDKGPPHDEQNPPGNSGGGGGAGLPGEQGANGGGD
jgi:hypothetical protein